MRAMRRCALSFVFFAALVFSPGSGASEIHVPKDYPTIQEALDAAVDGDTVWVHPGTYVENIDFKGKAVALRSTDGCGSTVIDGNRNGSVVAFRSGEPPEAVIDGFTITNGYQPTWNGGGIHCDEWASPTIINNLKIEADSLVAINKRHIKHIEQTRIHFAANKTEPLKKEEKILEKLALLLIQTEFSKLIITGYSDNSGPVSENLQYSLARAQSIANFLSSHGIDKNKISVQGRGEAEPLVTNDTEEGRKLNRRVEFSIIE